MNSENIPDIILLTITGGLLIFAVVGFIYMVHESFDYDKYEKFKSFCKDEGLIIEKLSDAGTPNCYEIEDNIIYEYIPKDKDGNFYLERRGRGFLE